jgi:transposase
VLRVEPPQVPKITGRPTSAGHDGQWRHRWHTCGRRAGAFRPPAPGCVLRSDRRQRALLLTYAVQHLQPRQTAGTPMQSTLPHVVSELTGGTGFALMRAILAGERDPMPLAPRRD